MDSVSVIGTMIAAGTFFVVLVVFAKPIGILLKIFVNACIGVIGLMAANFLLAPLNFSVGINLLTAGFIGALGFPGFISLYIIKIILG